MNTQQNCFNEQFQRYSSSNKSLFENEKDFQETINEFGKEFCKKLFNSFIFVN